MKIAFTHNLRLTDSEEEAEFDSAETVEAVAAALAAAGHEVEKIEVSGPASHLASRIEACAPDLIFNTAEGRRGRAREAFYPAFFEELGFPYTGSDAYVLTVTLDKWLTKQVLQAYGIDSPRGRLLTPAEFKRLGEATTLGLAYPVIVKPNYEGSSKGIGDDAVARDAKQLLKILDKALEAYPLGVLCEEFIPGTDICVPLLEGVGDEGLMLPVELVVDPAVRSRLNIYEYRLKHADSAKVQARCPADLPRDVTARVRALAKTIVRTLGLRDLGRVEFRLGEDGRICLLEVNPLPSLERGNDFFAAAAREGLSYDQTIAQVVRAAALRWGLEAPRPVVPKKRRDKLRIGFTFNMKRVDTKGGDDTEAEYDSPATIDAIVEALESLGHIVIPMEANADLPSDLPEADIDLVFNIAEGLTGRNREAAVPALCELLGIPYTGSDSATLAIALDKTLTKKVLKQHGILTPEFQLFETGREKISPALRYPCIVKPNAEGSSKGIASTSVVDDEASLRLAVRDCVGRYKQPALAEEYIFGREFTVGLLGDRRPRVLPPMEVVFKDRENPRPVYDFTIKQEWEKHVEYLCPAPLAPTELKAIERAARETFSALDCRDVARVDLRLNAAGEPYVIEINPLPGLTPGYSDLVLIAKAAGIDYRTLIAEILAGGVKRLREKRQKGRQEREAPSNGGRKADGASGGNGGSASAGPAAPPAVAPGGEA